MTLALASFLGSHAAWRGFLGGLHPGLVHFPIALLVVTALLEGVALARGASALSASTRTLLVIAAVTAVVACLFGWMRATYDDTEGALRTAHQWLGLSTAVVAVLAAWASAWQPASDTSVAMCRALVLIGAMLVLATGYFGGELVYGEGHLFKYFETTPGTKADVMAEPLPAAATAAPTVDFVRDVAPIIRTSCLKCHGPEKIKGRLRLDTKASAMAGGKHGESIVPGHSEKSRLYRLLIAPAPDDRMPQKADALPSHDVAIIRAWIDEGAAWPDGYVVRK